LKVCIGAGALTDAFPQQIGADAYVDDAPKIVKVATELLGEAL